MRGFGQRVIYPGDQQKAAGRYSQHDERPEMMFIRLPAHWAFSMDSRMALAIGRNC
jgi:hypothetical protein